MGCKASMLIDPYDEVPITHEQAEKLLHAAVEHTYLYAPPDQKWAGPGAICLCTGTQDILAALARGRAVVPYEGPRIPIRSGGKDRCRVQTSGHQYILRLSTPLLMKASRRAGRSLLHVSATTGAGKNSRGSDKDGVEPNNDEKPYSVMLTYDVSRPVAELPETDLLLMLRDMGPEFERMAMPLAREEQIFSVQDLAERMESLEIVGFTGKLRKEIIKTTKARYEQLAESQSMVEKWLEEKAQRQEEERLRHEAEMELLAKAEEEDKRRAAEAEARAKEATEAKSDIDNSVAPQDAAAKEETSTRGEEDVTKQEDPDAGADAAPVANVEPEDGTEVEAGVEPEPELELEPESESEPTAEQVEEQRVSQGEMSESAAAPHGQVKEASAATHSDVLEAGSDTEFVEDEVSGAVLAQKEYASLEMTPGPDPGDASEVGSSQPGEQERTLAETDRSQPAAVVEVEKGQESTSLLPTEPEVNSKNEQHDHDLETKGEEPDQKGAADTKNDTPSKENSSMHQLQLQLEDYRLAAAEAASLDLTREESHRVRFICRDSKTGKLASIFTPRGREILFEKLMEDLPHLAEPNVVKFCDELIERMLGSVEAEISTKTHTVSVPRNVCLMSSFSVGKYWFLVMQPCHEGPMASVSGRSCFNRVRAGGSLPPARWIRRPVSVPKGTYKRFYTTMRDATELRRRLGRIFARSIRRDLVQALDKWANMTWTSGHDTAGSSTRGRSHQIKERPIRGTTIAAVKKLYPSSSHRYVCQMLKALEQVSAGHADDFKKWVAAQLGIGDRRLALREHGFRFRLGREIFLDEGASRWCFAQAEIKVPIIVSTLAYPRFRRPCCAACSQRHPRIIDDLTEESISCVDMCLQLMRSCCLCPCFCVGACQGLGSGRDFKSGARELKELRVEERKLRHTKLMAEQKRRRRIQRYAAASAGNAKEEQSLPRKTAEEIEILAAGAKPEESKARPGHIEGPEAASSKSSPYIVY